MEYADMLHRCFRCGCCKLPVNFSDINCPAYLNNRFESFSRAGGSGCCALAQQEIKTSDRLARSSYSCATCNNCVEHCVFDKFKENLVKAFIAGRENSLTRVWSPPSSETPSSPCSFTAIPISCPRPTGETGPRVWT